METVVLLVALEQLALETVCLAAAVLIVRRAQRRGEAGHSGADRRDGDGGDRGFTAGERAAEAAFAEGVENLMGYDLAARRRGREG